MKTTKEYIEEAKRRLEVTDYRLAKILGVSQGAMSHYSTGRRTMDDTTAAKVAGILEIDPMQIIAAANAEREKGDKKEFWENFYKRLGGIAASIFLVVNLIMTPTPSKAAPVLNAEVSQCILC